MLRLKGITKNYVVAGKDIQVLKGLDICFRKNDDIIHQIRYCIFSKFTF